MKRITVLLGNYGSGKTELALNMALAARGSGEDVTLVDLDIVNPYFRSSEYRAMLEEKGVRVVAPVYANTAVDLPTLPPDVFTAFDAQRAVFDCGGDAVGASALGSLKTRFDAVRDETQMLFVVNTMRPFQQRTGEINESLAKIQQSARVQADGIVLNTNLGVGSQGDELVRGFEIAQAFASQAGLPIVAVSGIDRAIRAFKNEYPSFDGEYICMELYTRPEWLSDT